MGRKAGTAPPRIIVNGSLGSLPVSAPDEVPAPGALPQGLGAAAETSAPAPGAPATNAPTRIASARPAELLAALLAGLPDGVVVCDRFLVPLTAGAAARWLLEDDGGWARGRGAATEVRATAAAALDAGGVATRVFQSGGRRWEARAAPLRHAQAAVAVAVRPTSGLEGHRDAALRAAHDLKAPVHALDGFAKLLLREAAGPLTADQRRFLEIMAAETGRLRSHLEHVLETVGSGQPLPDRRAPAGPTEVAADVVAIAQETASRLSGACIVKDVRVEVDGGPGHRVAMPEAELGTILENLVENAVAVSPRGGVIRVEVGRSTSGGVRCSVADSGPGIPDAELERIFDPYFRVARPETSGGTGLGLAISRALAEARGGHLVAANRVGGGAILTLDLPAADEAQTGWPVLRVAPVTSHAELAAVSAAADRYLASPWRVASWEAGVLALEVHADPPVVQKAAADVAASTGFACWLGSGAP